MQFVIMYRADDGTVFSSAEEAAKRDKKYGKGPEEELANKANQLTSDLRYEFADGVHTRHQCNCDERPCRGRKCFMCLIEEFIDESY